LLKERDKIGNPELLRQQRRLLYSSTARMRWQGVLFSIFVVGVSTTILFGFGIAVYNVNMVYMLLTLLATLWFGLGAGVLTATLAFFCFDYFFLPPYFTLVIDALQGWIAIFLFLGTALLANVLAGRARLRSQQVQQRARETTALYELATTVITKIDQTEMLNTVLQQVGRALEATECTLFLCDLEKNAELCETLSIETVNSAFPHKHPNISLAQVAFNRQESIFLDSENLDESETSRQDSESTRHSGPSAYLPLITGSRALGVLALTGQVQADQTQFDPEEKQLIEIFANHVALAVEHSQLIRETAQLSALKETDKLKSALLASVSHELRTPLTSIKTFTANLQDKYIDWTEEKRTKYLGLISQETDRLTRLVSNLLDLSKIEAGVLQPDFGWHYLPEIVQTVIERLKTNPLTKDNPIITSFDPDIPLTRIDYVQIDQVLTNLLENAVKYSPPAKTISVEVRVKSSSQLNLPPGILLPEPDFPARVLLVRVVDEGMGIPPGQLERVFDKFYRVQTAQDAANISSSGTGIGLAISRGIIQAHSGIIWAEKRLYDGTIFNFILPVIPLPPELAAEMQ
jgi:two-component system sensor histidine kinase KdpD